jgi:DNA-binding response OmpR family regulator
LEARVEAVLRTTKRKRQPETIRSTEIRVRDLVISRSRGTAKLSNCPLHLTPTEYRLLEVMARDPQAVFDRRSLAERVLGYSDASCGHLVDVHIGRLRAKLRSADTGGHYVVTVRRRGFRLVEDGDR